MRAWSDRFGAADALAVLGVCMAAALASYVVTHPPALGLLLYAFLAIAVLTLPVELVAVLPVALANGAASWAPGVTVEKSAAAGVALAALLAARSAATRGLSRRQWIVGGMLVALLAVGLLNAASLIRLPAPTEAVRTMLPYGSWLLVLVGVPADRRPRVLAALAVVASVWSALYVASAFTGAGLVPGIVRVRSAAFAGHEIFRIWAPGGLLAVYGTLWAGVQLATRGSARSGRVVVLLCCSTATVVTLSRAVLLGTSVAILAAFWLAARGTRWRARAAVVALALLGFVAYSGGVLNPRAHHTFDEISTTSGNFGHRLALIESHTVEVKEHPWLGVGFTPGADYDLSDSGAFTIVVRFGVLGALCLAALLLLAWRHARALSRLGPDDCRLAAVCGGLLVFYVVTGLTVDALISAGGLSVLALCLGLLLGSATELDARWSGKPELAAAR